MSEAFDRLTAPFDPVVFVRGNLPWEGIVSTSALPRVAEAVVTASDLSWQVFPERTKEGRAASRFVVAGTLSLICPRCLEVVAWPVALERLVVWYRTAAAVPDEELEEADWDARVLDESVTLAELLEEELLLAWPQGPLHETCSLPGPAEAGAPFLPFSFLR